MEATRLVKGLELRMCQNNMGELGLLHPKKSRQQGSLIDDYLSLTGACRQHRAKLFKDVHGDGMRSNGSKLEHGNSS